MTPIRVVSFGGREQLRREGLSRLPKGSGDTRHLGRRLSVIVVWLLLGGLAVSPQRVPNHVGLLSGADLMSSLIMECVRIKQMLILGDGGSFG